MSELIVIATALNNVSLLQ